MENKILSKDELVKTIGTRIEPTAWIELSQERINTFAECTGDDYFIHVDVEKAKQTDLGWDHCSRPVDAVVDSVSDEELSCT